MFVPALMVCIAVKTTLFVDIVIERNLEEKEREVSLLNITAPPYLQLILTWGLLVVRSWM